MNKYLILDSGGTKTAAILCGVGAERLGVCVTGSLRSNTTPDGLYERNIADIVGSLGLFGAEIEAVYGTCEPRAIELLKQSCVIKRTEPTGEMLLGLYAAGIFGDGVLSLCGTGSTVFALYNGKKYAAGGYGAAVSDEGSGYYIGRQAFIYAIRDHEGRGEKTALTKMLASYLKAPGEEDLRGAIFSLYTQSERSPVAAVARFAPFAVEAARDGDAAALRIIREAGRLMGEQTAALIVKNSLPDGLPLAISGSVWRGNPVMFEEFRKTVLAQCPGREIRIPKLEPAAGAIAKALYDAKGSFTDEDVKTVTERYPEFVYDITKSKFRRDK